MSYFIIFITSVFQINGKGKDITYKHYALYQFEYTRIYNFSLSIYFII